MSRVFVLAGLLGWLGATLVLSDVRWFGREPLADRLRPYAPGGLGASSGRARWSILSFRELFEPIAQNIGERAARMFGVSEELGAKLRRFHSPLTIGEFRTRQLGFTMSGFFLGAIGALAFRLPPALAALLTMGGPLLAFLILEQQVQTASRRWQRNIFCELAVVTEQLGMLLSAGYSLGGALNRLAVRSNGAVGQDLTLVCGRIRHGLTELEALREWAALAQVDALDRLVGVLALNREGGDLGKLIAEEARSVRGDAHRELLETIERRAQQVWVPVTVATLVPGVLFMAVPFVEAMRLFTGS